MIPAILWKEWRDQRTIAVTILVFGALALALTALFNPARAAGVTIMEQAGARELMALTIAYLAGSVCGSMLLADEKEVGTLEFLDTLPCTRFQLWRSKTTYGIVFSSAMSGVIAGLAFAFDCVDNRVPWWWYVFFIWMVGMHGFAWGLFGGAIARSTLGAVFQGAVGSVIVGIFAAVPFVLVVGPIGFGRNFTVSLFLYYFVWMLSGLVLSAFAFSGIDRKRGLIAWEPEWTDRGRPAAKIGFQFRLFSLIWLSAKQSVWILAGACIAGAVIGAGMLAPDLSPMLVWPLATLLLGVLAGVTTMSEEQTRGVARFWAERRLPLGRLWITKTAFHFLIGVIAASLMAVPLLLNTPSSPFRTRLLFQVELGLRSNLSAFLWFGLVYGFVMGHLSGMLFRKTIVAGLFAVLTAAILSGFLVPSLVGGGVNRWQLWGPAAVLLLTARAILYPWATDRILHRGPVLRALGGTTLAVALLGAGIVYRVYEIPDSPDLLEKSGYEGIVSVFDANDSGRTTRAIASQYRKASDDAQNAIRNKVGPESNRPNGIGLERTQLDRMANVGWTPQTQFLKPWLDQVFKDDSKDDWVNRLIDLDNRPEGMFENPWELTHFSPLDDVRNFREMIVALRLRGTQRQAEGDSEAFPKLFRGGLAAVRNARFRGSWRTPEAALEAEEVLMLGLGSWLKNLQGRPDLLKDVLAALIRHERDMDVGIEDVFWAERVVLSKTFENIGTWLPNLLEDKAFSRGGERGPADLETQVVSASWIVPWERARRERLLRLNTDANAEIYFRWLSGLHLRSVWRLERWPRLRDADRRGLTSRRFAMLRAALMVYQADHGKPADKLEDLMPKYIPAIPLDPFSDQPFRYRVSKGEIVDFDTNLRIGGWSRPDLAMSDFLPALVRFEHLVEAIPRLLQTSVTPNAPQQPRAVGINMMQPISAIRPVRRVIPAGSGIIWSCGADGRDDDGKRYGLAVPGDSTGYDWIEVVTPMNAKGP